MKKYILGMVTMTLIVGAGLGGQVLQFIATSSYACQKNKSAFADLFFCYVLLLDTKLIIKNRQ